MIYLDNHTTTQACTPAVDRMLYYLKESWGAPNVLNGLGMKAAEDLENLYAPIYQLLSLEPEDSFVFTSSSTEAVNHLIYGSFLEYTRKSGKNQFIVMANEDAPFVYSLQRLEDEFDCTIKTIPQKKDGYLDLEALKKAFSPKTALVSLSLAQGLSGVIQPIHEVHELCKAHDVPLHLDGTYALSKIPLPLDWSYLTFAGDRLHAPKSTGGVAFKKNFSLQPLLLGGKEQNSLRGAHLDMASFAALSTACQQALFYLDQMSLETVRLRTKLEEELVSLIPNAMPLFIDSNRLPNVSVISFPGVWYESLLYFLNQKGVIASAGGGFSPQLGSMLLSMGYSKEIAYTSISFSLSRYTTEEEIDKVVPLITEVVKKLQALSGSFV